MTWSNYYWCQLEETVPYQPQILWHCDTGIGERRPWVPLPLLIGGSGKILSYRIEPFVYLVSRWCCCWYRFPVLLILQLPIFLFLPWGHVYLTSWSSNKVNCCSTTSEPTKSAPCDATIMLCVHFIKDSLLFNGMASLEVHLFELFNNPV